jgi:Flp pilus assembly protein CpaB
MDNLNFPTPGGFPAGGPSQNPGLAGQPLGNMPGRPSGAQSEPAKPAKAKKERKGKAPGEGRKILSKQLKLALLLGAATAGLAWFALQGTAESGIYAVQADVRINALSSVAPDQVVAVAVPEELLLEGAFSGSSEAEALEQFQAVADSRVLYPVSKGQMLTQEMFILADEFELAADERLVSVTAPISGAVGGRLRVGDRVDLIGIGNEVSTVLVTDVEIVAITLAESSYDRIASEQTSGERDRTVDEFLPGDPVPGTYTLRLKADAAPSVTLIDRSGSTELVLVYRDPQGEDALESGPVGIFEVLCAADQIPTHRLPSACLDQNGQGASYPEN